MKKRRVRLLIIGLVVIGVTACCKPKEQPKSVTPARSDVQRAAPMPGPDSSPAAKPNAKEIGDAAGPGAAANPLVGTTWLVGDVTVTFKDGASAFAKGGMLAQVAPDGLDVAYTLKDSIVEIGALGQTMTGTFDGTKLVIDGKVALRQQ